MSEIQIVESRELLQQLLKSIDTPVPPGEMLLTEKDAAAMLSLNPGTLAVWRCTRKINIPYIVLSSSAIRYRMSDIRKFLDGRTVDESGNVPAGVTRHKGGKGRPPGYSPKAKKKKAVR